MIARMRAIVKEENVSRGRFCLCHGAVLLICSRGSICRVNKPHDKECGLQKPAQLQAAGMFPGMVRYQGVGTPST